MATTEHLKDKPKNRAITTPIDGIIKIIAQRIGGEKAKEIERFIKFAMVGILGFCLDFGILIFLQSALLPPVNETGDPLHINVAIATSAGFIAAVTSNFIWNRYWTYPDSRSQSIKKQLIQFAIVSVIGWSARTLWILLAHQPVGNLFYPLLKDVPLWQGLAEADAAARIGTNLTQFVGVFVIMIWNFLANRFWTYSDVD
ncbi:MAG: GtrA family protein [Aggregatilineales bacterium]